MKTFKEFVEEVEKILNVKQESSISYLQEALSNRELQQVLFGENNLDLSEVYHKFQSEEKTMENIIANAKLVNLNLKARVYATETQNPKLKELTEIINVMSGDINMFKNKNVSSGYVGIGNSDFESEARSKLAGSFNDAVSAVSSTYGIVRGLVRQGVSAVQAPIHTAAEYKEQKTKIQEAKQADSKFQDKSDAYKFSKGALNSIQKVFAEGVNGVVEAFGGEADKTKEGFIKVNKMTTYGTNRSSDVFFPPNKVTEAEEARQLFEAQNYQLPPAVFNK